MNTIFPWKRKEKVRKKERKLTDLVDRKERKEKRVDDYGRDVVMTLRDYLQNPHSDVKYRAIMKEAKRYIKNNK